MVSKREDHYIVDAFNMVMEYNSCSTNKNSRVKGFLILSLNLI